MRIPINIDEIPIGRVSGSHSYERNSKMLLWMIDNKPLQADDLQKLKLANEK